jgi:hypothetical protein
MEEVVFRGINVTQVWGSSGLVWLAETQLRRSARVAFEGKSKILALKKRCTLVESSISNFLGLKLRSYTSSGKIKQRNI